MRLLHSRTCSFNATNTPDGDFCNCEGIVELSKAEYQALKVDTPTATSEALVDEGKEK